MDLKQHSVRSEDLVNVGVLGLADTPNLSALEVQRKFEETAREVIIPRHNALVEALMSAQAAEGIGAADPKSGEKSTVQAVLTALRETVEKAVSTAVQELTAEQQAQARENIAAVGQDEYISWFEKGEGIPMNADLDAYTTPGKFYAQAASIVNSLANKPEGMNSNFCMFVFDRTSNTQSQLLVTLSGKMYIRSKSTGSWYSWVEYATEDDVEERLEGTKEELLAQIVHADWNENDPLNKAYVKNRPVYLAAGKVLAKEQEVMVANDELCAPVEGDFTLEPGRMYEVFFEGEPYDCFAYTASVSGSTVLGNLGVNPDAGMEGENKGSGEPFAVLAGTNGVWLYTETKGEFRIKIADPEGEGNTVVIDERYRGAFGVNANWTQNDPTAPDYIKNRPFYGGGAKDVLFAGVIVAEEYEEVGMANFTGSRALETGKTYAVHFDGVQYTCLAYTVLMQGGGSYAVLGNGDLADEEIPGASYTGGGSEPFGIVDWGDGDMTVYTTDPGTYSLELAQGSDIVRLDEKYLPESVVRTGEQSFSAAQKAQARKNIGALGAGEVKSAYETAQEGGYLGTEEEFAAKLATDFIDWFGVGASIPEGADLNNYKTNGKYYASSESRAKTLLNRPDGMNTNFCMWVFQRTTSTIYSQLLLTLHGKLYFRSSNSSKWNAWVEYTTSDEIEALTQQVKAELLKAVGKPDWMQNDPAAAGYIENRPFCVTDETAETAAEEQVVDVPNTLYEGELCGTLEMAALPQANQVYEVTFNGAKYRCTAYGHAAEGYVILGNTDINADVSMFELENKGNGEPFCILHGGPAATVQLFTETAGEYLVSIRRLKVLRLEERFLPESVDGVVLRSSTPYSERKFRITVNDSGIISTTPV